MLPNSVEGGCGSMSDLVITTTVRESMASIAQAICDVWEAEVDTPAVYAENCRVHNADLEHSVMGFMPDGRLVGIGVLCRRGDRGFVLDFGIAPPFRGRGLGHRLFEALLDQARQACVAEVSLIVSGDNAPAQRIYLQAGFQHSRELVTLRGKIAAYAPASAVESHSDRAATIMAWFGGGKAARPVWERDLPSLLAMSAVRAFENQHGFLLTRLSPYFRQVDIVHLALDPGAVTEDVNALLYATGVAFGDDLPLALLEEPLGSRACQKLLDLGFREVERQYEMRIAL
jgi:ribosomal protein S18 acetylase RimI-like enzyme